MRRLRPRCELHVDGEFGVTSNLGFPEGIDRGSIGIVIVDHGSRREESNRRHEAIVTEWRTSRGYPIVEPAR
jgi:hypothetical protein